MPGRRARGLTARQRRLRPCPAQPSPQHMRGCSAGQQRPDLPPLLLPWPCVQGSGLALRGPISAVFRYPTVVMFCEVRAWQGTGGCGLAASSLKSLRPCICRYASRMRMIGLHGQRATTPCARLTHAGCRLPRAQGGGIAAAKALIEATPDQGGLSFRRRGDVRMYYRVRLNTDPLSLFHFLTLVLLLCRGCGCGSCLPCCLPACPPACPATRACNPPGVPSRLPLPLPTATAAPGAQRDGAVLEGPV